MIDYISFVLYSLLICFLGKRMGEKAPECAHQWGIHHKEQYELIDIDGTLIKRFDRYHLRCTKCGEMTKRDMK